MRRTTSRSALDLTRLTSASLLLTLLLLTSGTAAPATGEELLTPRRLQTQSPAPFSVQVGATSSGGQCLDGIVYDDGTVEDGLAFGNAPTLDLVMRFDIGSTDSKVEDVCVCWTRNPDFGPSTDLPFEIVFYEVAQDGLPGEFITAVPQTAPDIPAFMESMIYSYDLRGEDLTIADDQVYVGVSWIADAEPEFFLCTDDNGTGNQPIFASNDLGVTWANVRELDPPPGEDPESLSGIASLVLRTTIEQEQRQPFTCVEDATTLCLSDDRFEVTVDWRTPPNIGTSGVGNAVELTGDTGYFWFFEAANVEMVIKVLNACSFADRFWVFAGGLTNVEVEITVADSETGRVKTYENPLNQPFLPIQDTDAFATCP